MHNNDQIQLSKMLLLSKESEPKESLITNNSPLSDDAGLSLSTNERYINLKCNSYTLHHKSA